MSLLLRNVKTVVSCDDNDTIYNSVDIYCEDGKIIEIGKDLNVGANEVVNCTDMIMYPGLINAHHHMYQIFSRNLPKAQNLKLFDWLLYMYEIWKGLNEEVIYYSSKVSLSELLKSGCTTCFDHHYIFPNGTNEKYFDAFFSASDELGIRLSASRGSMNLSRKDGGLPPDELVQSIDEILKDSEKAIDKYHDESFGSMHNIVLAPCSPFSASSDLYRESAVLARNKNVRLHTHLCESLDEEKFTLENFSMRPLEYMQSLNFVGEDVWYAHGIHFNDDELDLLSKTKTGICHCPISNMKLSSGAAKIPEMLKRNIKVGLGVDGSASNDGSNLLEELRVGYLLSRLVFGDDSPSAYDFLKIATCGSAKVIGRDDLGKIEVGKCADMFMISEKNIELVGATYDPKSLFATIGYKKPVDITVVNGKVVVKEQKLVNIDEEDLYFKAQEVDDKYIK